MKRHKFTHVESCSTAKSAEAPAVAKAMAGPSFAFIHGLTARGFLRRWINFTIFRYSRAEFYQKESYIPLSFFISKRTI